MMAAGMALRQPGQDASANVRLGMGVKNHSQRTPGARYEDEANECHGFTRVVWLSRRDGPADKMTPGDLFSRVIDVVVNPPSAIS